MVYVLVLLTIVVFVLVDIATRLVVRRLDRARQRRQRQEALDIGLKLPVSAEAKTLKRVEVKDPKARILAVDDEPVVLDTFRKILVLAGYSVDTVESGQEAMNLIQARDYDFVFTDLKMPEYDGLEVTKAVKQVRPDIDVVMITGYGTIESAVDAMKFGAMDYVQKPFTEDELVSFTDKCLFRRQDRLERELPPKIHLVTASSPESNSEHVFNVPAGVFSSPEHVWVRIELTGEARVGIDDFARKTLGDIEEIVLPRKGRTVQRGQPLFTVKGRGASVTFPSPISGEVSRVNLELVHRPDFLKINPYEIGWICLLAAGALTEELKRLRLGADAIPWYQDETERFRAALREAAGGPEEAPAAAGKSAEATARDEAHADLVWKTFPECFFNR